MVEFALVAPILFALILGSIEFGRAMMASSLLANAARIGARSGALSGGDNSAIISAVTTNLTSAGIQGATTRVLVNGKETDARTAVTGDTITVQVAVPAARVSWLPFSLFLRKNTQLSQTVVMRRE